MPQYTTSYSNKRSGSNGAKRRRSKNGLGTLPNSRRSRKRKAGGSYLKRSQGFGNRSARQRRGANKRAPMAFVAIGCAFAVFLAVVIWYLNRGVEITLNDETVSVRVNSTVEQLISDQGLDDSTRAGNLLAVDDSILEKGAGERYAITLNDEVLPEAEILNVKLEGGEVLAIEDGNDVYEEHDVAATEIAPTISVSGTGAIQYVKTWGVPGRSEVWTGKKSGVVADRGVVQEVVNCEIACSSVTPSGNEKYIALTFDEGPSQGTQQILDILAEKDVKATFFLQGDRVSAYGEAARAIASAGHEIGSNSASDTDLSVLSGEDLRAQLAGGFDAISSTTGASTALLRAPYASFSAKNWSEAADIVSAVISWNIDSGDWLLQGADSVVDTVVGSAKSGNIVLLTDNDATCAQLTEALPRIIDGLQEAGFKIVTLSDLVATDEELSKELSSLDAVFKPEGAVLPSYTEDSGAEA